MEVVFGFQLSRPWQPAEIEALAGNHHVWKSDLPRLARHEIQQIVIGEGAPQPVALPGGPGISFERIKPNGDLAWRLRCEGNAIFVNCLEYTRWQDAWAIASGHIRAAFNAIGAKKISVSGALLQYVDVFDWAGDPAEYNAFQLLNADSDYIPRAAEHYGLAWHLHQGWFVRVRDPLPGRILEKVHFDAYAKNENGQPTVKMDTLLRSDFEENISAAKFLEMDSLLERSFIQMHDMNKALLLRILSSDVCRNIGLEGGI